MQGNRTVDVDGGRAEQKAHLAKCTRGKHFEHYYCTSKVKQSDYLFIVEVQSKKVLESCALLHGSTAFLLCPLKAHSQVHMTN